MEVDDPAVQNQSLEEDERNVSPMICSDKTCNRWFAA